MNALEKRGARRLDSTNPPRGAPLPQSRFSVVLVEPQYADNVGHAARSLLNFGVGELILVRAGGVPDLARQRAVHAQDVLDQAIHADSLDEIKPRFEHLVGFAARISTLDKAHLRHSEDLPTVARRLEGFGGRIGLVFGREDFGLSNEDVERCDLLCTIPTSAHYRSMNLSHAVSVALYELTRPEHDAVPGVTMASRHEREVLLAAWLHLNATLGFKPHRQEQALMMFQRLIGRAGLSAWEYHRIMGVLSRSLKRLHAWPPPGVGEGTWTAYEGDDETPGEHAEDAPR